MTLLDEMAEALRCWKLFMPITDGDTLYSCHPKVMTEEVLKKYEAVKDSVVLVPTLPVAREFNFEIRYWRDRENNVRAMVGYSGDRPASGIGGSADEAIADAIDVLMFSAAEGEQ